MPPSAAKPFQNAKENAMDFTYHRSLDHLHVGCERPHAYFIPFGSAAAADRAEESNNRNLSDRFRSLCGDWQFRWFASLNDVPDFTAPGFSMEDADPDFCSDELAAGARPRL